MTEIKAGFIAGGTTCPLCGKAVRVKKHGHLYDHRGTTPTLVYTPGNRRFQHCPASGRIPEEVSR